MELGETLAVVNLAGIVIVAFIGWNAIRATKQQVMELVNRDLAEVRRQIRTSMKSLDRVQDHVADNREDILKIEVNIASMQDELESMSRTLDAFMSVQQIKDGNAEEESQDEDSEQRHLYK